MGQRSVPLPCSVLLLLPPVLVLWQLGGARAQGTCPVPERLQYAELDQPFREMKDFPVGTEISFTCRPGYMRASGMALTRTCGADLQWSPTGVFCKARKCEYPGDLENGYFNPGDLTFGSKLTFACNEGYRLRGNEEISCNIRGEGVGWSGTLPYCEKIPCEPPPKIANGEYEERASYEYQSSVTYKCREVPRGSDPFFLIGASTIYCTSDAHSNGVWSAPPPECRVVKCEDPRVENGRKTSGFGFPYRYKDSVVFQCDPGYFMIGADVITCGENNAWVPPIPTCKKISAAECPAPKIPNGVLVPDKRVYDRGESVQIRCNAGCSFPDGSAEVTVTCQEQSSWGALQPCACEPEGSGSTPVISYGRVTAGQKPSYSVGDLITIECYTGYTLHGEAQIRYMGNNRWAPAVPTCQLSGYIIAIICVIVVVVLLLAAFWIYKKFFSQNGFFQGNNSKPFMDFTVLYRFHRRQRQKGNPCLPCERELPLHLEAFSLQEQGKPGCHRPDFSQPTPSVGSSGAFTESKTDLSGHHKFFFLRFHITGVKLVVRQALLSPGENNPCFTC